MNIQWHNGGGACASSHLGGGAAVCGDVGISMGGSSSERAIMVTIGVAAVPVGRDGADVCGDGRGSMWGAIWVWAALYG